MWSVLSSLFSNKPHASIEIEMTEVRHPSKAEEKWETALIWAFKERKITIFQKEDKFKYQVIDFESRMKWHSDISFPPSINGMEISYLSNCQPKIEGQAVNFEPFSKVRPAWLLENERKIILINEQNDLIWQLYDLNTKTITQAPLENCKLYNTGLTKYHFDQLFKTPSSTVPTGWIGSDVHKDLDGPNIYVPISVFLRHIPSTPRQEIFGSSLLSGLLKSLGISRNLIGRNPEVVSTFPDEKDVSIQNFISYVKDCKITHIEKLEDKLNTVLLKKPIAPSKCDKNLMLDMDRWAVTFMDNGKSNADCFSWGGHAKLVIEGVNEEGEYFMHVSDIRQGKRVGKLPAAEVTLHENESLSDQKKVLQWKKSKTFIREKSRVEEMLESIRREIKLQNEGNPQVCFEIGGGDNLVAKDKTKKYGVQFHNCTTWVNSKLRMLNIVPRLDSNDKIIATPKNRIKRGFKVLTELP